MQQSPVVVGNDQNGAGSGMSDFSGNGGIAAFHLPTLNAAIKEVVNPSPEDAR